MLSTVRKRLQAAFTTCDFMGGGVGAPVLSGDYLLVMVTARKGFIGMIHDQCFDANFLLLNFNFIST